MYQRLLYVKTSESQKPTRLSILTLDLLSLSIGGARQGAKSRGKPNRRTVLLWAAVARI